MNDRDAIRVRRALPEDAPTIAALSVHVQKLHADERPDLFKQPVVDEARVHQYETRIAGPATEAFIVEVNGEPAGYILGEIMHRPEDAMVTGWESLHIQEISVNPEFQHRGCGERLIQAAFDAARQRNIHRVVLEVWNFNTDAQAFFHKQGFEVYNLRMESYLP
jgi:diamine N-acetyltransferase